MLYICSGNCYRSLLTNNLKRDETSFTIAKIMRLGAINMVAPNCMLLFSKIKLIFLFQ